jgi:hypothetical protein
MRYILFILTFLIFSGCGGGGSSSKYEYSTTVLNSYRINADVYADGIKYTSTDQNGHFSFSTDNQVNIISIKNGQNSITLSSVNFTQKAYVTDPYISVFTTIIVDANYSVKDYYINSFSDIINIDYNTYTQNLQTLKKALILNLIFERTFNSLSTDTVPQVFYEITSKQNLNITNETQLNDLINALAVLNINYDDIKQNLINIMNTSQYEEIKNEYINAEKEIFKITSAPVPLPPNIPDIPSIN